jgi:nitrogen fixation protein
MASEAVLQKYLLAGGRDSLAGFVLQFPALPEQQDIPTTMRRNQ